MDNKEYLAMVGKKKINRVMSWICIIIIVALVIATIVTGLAGSEYFLGVLCLTMIVPVLMYVILWIGKVMAGVALDKSVLENEEKEEDK